MILFNLIVNNSLIKRVTVSCCSKNNKNKYNIRWSVICCSPKLSLSFQSISWRSPPPCDVFYSSEIHWVLILEFKRLKWVTLINLKSNLFHAEFNHASSFVSSLDIIPRSHQKTEVAAHFFAEVLAHTYVFVM